MRLRESVERCNSWPKRRKCWVYRHHTQGICQQRFGSGYQRGHWPPPRWVCLLFHACSPPQQGLCRPYSSCKWEECGFANACFCRGKLFIEAFQCRGMLIGPRIHPESCRTHQSAGLCNCSMHSVAWALFFSNIPLETGIHPCRIHSSVTHREGRVVIGLDPMPASHQVMRLSPFCAVVVRRYVHPQYDAAQLAAVTCTNAGSSNYVSGQL